MAEQRDNLSASDGSSNSGVPSVRSVDVSERVSALEISLSSIQSNLQRLVGMQTHSVTADNSGINSQFSEVPGPSLGSSVPPFITVSSGIFFHLLAKVKVFLLMRQLMRWMLILSVVRPRCR